ncbi:hypothetical protein ACIPRI_00335 [Variovorax sp. LARHSF232]
MLAGAGLHVEPLAPGFDRVEVRIELVDARQIGLHHFAAGQLAGVDRARLRIGIKIGEVAHAAHAAHV